MIRRILVPFDLSPSSDAALSIASSICGIVSARLVGLFVEDIERFQRVSLAVAVAENITGESITPMALAPEEQLRQETEIEKESVELFARFQERCEDAKIEGTFLSLRGEAAQVIVEQAKSVDLVILGRSGSHYGISGRERGATLEALLRATTAPVIAVPEDPSGQSSVLVAYDGTKSAERTLRAVVEIAQLVELEEIHLVTVQSSTQEGERIQEPALRYLSDYNVKVQSVVRSGTPAEVILEYSREMDASLIAIGAFGGNRLAELIFGSTTHSVIQGSATAILLVP